jgi:hypothetical protein
MTYFTPGYKKVTSMSDLPFTVRIKHEDSDRWICYQYRSLYGKNYEYTFIDNFLDIYRIYWTGPETNDFIGHNTNLINIISNEYTDNPESITFKRPNHGLNHLPLPDFAIDVLETVENHLAFEIISRIVKSFHSKLVNK